MREILFRGRAGSKGQEFWAEGFGVRMGEEGPSVLYAGDGDRRYIVDTDTVGQFTGLTDKNGKKIFEGDILSNANVKGVVFYSDKYACFMLRWKNFYENKFREDFFKECRLTDFVLFEYMEVIGNIHDNPELLDGGNGNA